MSFSEKTTSLDMRTVSLNEYIDKLHTHTCTKCGNVDVILKENEPKSDTQILPKIKDMDDGQPGIRMYPASPPNKGTFREGIKMGTAFPPNKTTITQLLLDDWTVRRIAEYYKVNRHRVYRLIRKHKLEDTYAKVEAIQMTLEKKHGNCNLNPNRTLTLPKVHAEVLDRSTPPEKNYVRIPKAKIEGLILKGLNRGQIGEILGISNKNLVNRIQHSGLRKLFSEHGGKIRAKPGTQKEKSRIASEFLVSDDVSLPPDWRIRGHNQKENYIHSCSNIDVIKKILSEEKIVTLISACVDRMASLKETGEK